MAGPVNADADLHFLEQPTRRRILEHLRLLPGDHFRSIVRSLHLSVGTTRYHLAGLVKKGFLRSERIGAKLRYFTTANAAKPPLNETFEHYWKYRDLRTRVWLAVIRMPQARPSTVAKSLGVSRQLAAYHLSRLAELGLVTHGHGHYRAVDPRRSTSGHLLLPAGVLTSNPPRLPRAPPQRNDGAAATSRPGL